jgi:hypothetical protein
MVYRNEVASLPRGSVFRVRISKTGAVGKLMDCNDIGGISTFPATMIMSISICTV